MEALNRILRAQAISHGLCKQWTEEWDLNGDMESLINKYKRGIDFCCANNYPSKEFIKSHFDNDLLLSKHIYVDEHVVMENAPTDTYIIQGNSDVTLSFSDYSAAFLWIRDNSKVEVFAKGNARIFVHAYNECDCKIHLQDASRIVLHQVSDTANVTTYGKNANKE